jgi:NADH dehydrogenase/NADH:ubiquinone oxidoreductase subunit G
MFINFFDIFVHKLRVDVRSGDILRILPWVNERINEE